MIKTNTRQFNLLPPGYGRRPGAGGGGGGKTSTPEPNGISTMLSEARVTRSVVGGDTQCMRASSGFKPLCCKALHNLHHFSRCSKCSSFRCDLEHIAGW